MHIAEAGLVNLQQDEIGFLTMSIRIQVNAKTLHALVESPWNLLQGTTSSEFLSLASMRVMFLDSITECAFIADCRRPDMTAWCAKL